MTYTYKSFLPLRSQTDLLCDIEDSAGSCRDNEIWSLPITVDLHIRLFAKKGGLDREREGIDQSKLSIPSLCLDLFYAKSPEKLYV